MEADPKGKERRPKLVWVIFLWLMFSAGYTSLSFFLIFSGMIAVGPEQAAYFRSLSILDYATTLGIALLNMAGAVSLLLLRKVALYLFVAPLLLTLMTTISQALSRGLFAALGGPGMVGMLIGYGISVAICVYTWKLKVRGVLV